MLIFFDVDGVLIDGWHADAALRKPWDATITADLGVDRAAFQTRFFGASGQRSEALMHQCVIGRLDLAEALAGVLPDIGYRGEVKDFMRYWFEKDSNLNAAVLHLVAELKRRADAKVYIATGQEHHRARYLWNDLGLSERFDGMFYSASLGYPKKDVRFFEAINQTLRIDPAQPPLFFDDQPEIVACAQSAGWDAAVFRSAGDVSGHPRLQHLALGGSPRR
ncbi:haloacid dehalogenase [Mesorhizobium sp. BR1-1-16]|uniref:HAD family hydrolase n=1 Tax=Mesorhizobium sp. BR1-1-16 TaxID=2876653 RepID=UPI001CCA672E|nr:HAD family hydrolase [Mesorhizobium sp. BR1-1-16]MBZ9937412.1 haloacid dehalogenase [Mesorhizobium sp. BR1-1-16]